MQNFFPRRERLGSQEVLFPVIQVEHLKKKVALNDYN